MSSGGLVSALSGLKKLMSFIWIGFEVEAPEDRKRLTEDLSKLHACHPVFLTNEIVDLYYNGFSNSTLWPLFHYQPGEIDFNEAQWDAYYRANVTFAAAIKEIAQEGDMIWVQDYHLMLLPALLREMLADLSNIRIGFFLHTPFPSSEVYRVLPVRKQILLGVLQCDLIGFHTYDYARHFLSSCARILGIATLPNGVDFDGRFVHVGTFPIGIDPDKFIGALEKPEVQTKIRELETRLAGKRLIVGVDRLDYIKGVPHKLHAFDHFLMRYPQYQGKVTLLQVAVPTRTEVEEYKNLRTSVNELVGRINGKYGTFDFIPVQYLYRSVSFEDLVALYRVASVCVVTSTRDGMNLVSYEYVATQKERNGVLVLSEFAGAAQSMNGAIIVNPWSIDDLVEAYHEALSMPKEMAARQHERLLAYVAKHTASYWGQSFVTELQRIAKSTEGQPIKRFIKLSSALLRDIITREPMPVDGRTRLIVISINDQTLAALSGKGGIEFAATGDSTGLLWLPSTAAGGDTDASASSISVSPHRGDRYKGAAHLLETISQMALRPGTLVYLLAGEGRRTMENIFSHGNVGLVSENGCFLRHPMSLRAALERGRFGVKEKNEANCPTSAAVEGDGWIKLAEHLGEEGWRERVEALLRFYTDHTPGSKVEEREKTLVWNYADCEREYAQWQASELQASLEKILGQAPVRVAMATHSLCVLPAQVDRIVAARRILADLSVTEQPISLTLVACQEPADDGLFTIFSQAPLTNCEHVTLTIGKRKSSAKYYVSGIASLTPLLSTFLGSC